MVALKYLIVSLDNENICSLAVDIANEIAMRKGKNIISNGIVLNQGLEEYKSKIREYNRVIVLDSQAGAILRNSWSYEGELINLNLPKFFKGRKEELNSQLKQRLEKIS